MLDIEKITIYQAFGLHILSEFTLPELLTPHQVDHVDVLIKKVKTWTNWNEISDPSHHYMVKGSTVWFHVPDLAIFTIQGGNKIMVSPMPQVDEDKLRLYLLGTCFAILLMQRSVIPLHGSVIAIDGKAYAFVGHRGAGKSTLASAFMKAGFRLLTDDIIPVMIDKNLKPVVIPSYPQQKLWQESLSEMGWGTENLLPLFERETKYAVPVTRDFHNEPLSLGGVFELTKQSDNDDITLSKIHGLECLHILYTHTFRQFLIDRMGLRDWHFEASTIVAQRIGMYQIRRPTSTFTANELVTLILETIQKESTK